MTGIQQAVVEQGKKAEGKLGRVDSAGYCALVAQVHSGASSFSSFSVSSNFCLCFAFSFSTK